MHLDEVVASVVKSLKHYESGFTSVKRNPIDPQERVNDLGHFIECRFNFECFKVDELRELEELTDGRLFSLHSILGVNGQSYDLVTMKLSEIINMEYRKYDYDSARNRIESLLGGTSITFSSNIDDLLIKISRE